jgi:hypothetical protein
MPLIVPTKRFDLVVIRLVFSTALFEFCVSTLAIRYTDDKFHGSLLVVRTDFVVLYAVGVYVKINKLEIFKINSEKLLDKVYIPVTFLTLSGSSWVRAEVDPSSLMRPP